MLGRRQEKEPIREVPFGPEKDPSLGARFPENVVVTSKYTPLTFLPLNLFEQLRKAANFYFTLLSLVLFIGEQSNLYMESLKAYSTFLTLAVMMSASAVMAGLDDYRRHKSDRAMNSQAARAIRDGRELCELKWFEVKVGDILLVKGEEEFPADIVPLACSGDEGHCYVSTANLDGETNLKLKAAVSSMQTALCGEETEETEETTQPLASAENGFGSPQLSRAVHRLQRYSGLIKAEPPQTSIHNFTGSFKLGEAEEEGLVAKNLLLRGTTLRNTAWVFGVVVYTGKNTRVVMNSRKSPMKLSNLERVINVSMLVFLAAQLVMALITDIFFNVNKDTFRGYWYLYPKGSADDTGIILPDVLGYLITFFGLYSNLIPISLYFTCEMCNAAQAYFISCDLEMYDKEFESSAMARTTNLCQEIGQVVYIFSDKTGTLTQNVMELKRVSISGCMYGTVTEERGFNGKVAMDAAAKTCAKQREAMGAFLEVLSVSHTVMATYDPHGKLLYEAESPDEDALVTTASELGWTFNGRLGTEMYVDVQVDGKPVRQSYTVLALNAFTSARKRMSVVVRRDTGDYVLLVKGADNVMLDRAVASDPILESHLTAFAQEGLRTLVIGRRVIPQTEFETWHEKYEKAQRALQDRDVALAEAAEEIEQRLELLGATAIEDKLQVGVGQTIMRLRTAGIKLWVLTGDKLETARNIGYSTRVLSEDMEVLILDAHEKAKEMEDQMSALEQILFDVGAEGKRREAGMMVTGQALEIVLGSETLEVQFLRIASRCSVVIACRVSPLQKAEMVKLVRTRVKPCPVTLAVGDGANDVPMIQEAQVGVGICGREGRQAVNAADFAIAQFRFLQRLLLVHGRLNYRRACKFTLYTFWRNAAQVLLMFFYSFMSGYSGISLFEDKVRMSFNLITSLPIIATGMFDRDVSDDAMLEHPMLYEVGRLGRDLNPRKMAECLLSATVHSVIILLASVATFPGMDLHGAGDYFTWGTAVYSGLIAVCSYRVAFLTLTWNRIVSLTLFLSVAVYIMGLFVYGFWKSLGPPMFHVPIHMTNNLPFWFALVAILCVAIAVDCLSSWVMMQFFPDPKDLILENVQEGRLQKVTGLVAEQAPVAVKPAALKRVDSSFAFDHPLEVPGSSGPRMLATLAATPQSAGQTSRSNSKEATATAGAPRAQTPPLQMPSQPKEKLPSQPTQEKEGPTSAPTTKLLGGGPGRPPESKFAQQKLPSRQSDLTWQKALGAPLGSSIVLAILAIVASASQSSVKEVRILYDGKAHSDATATHICAAGEFGSTTSCIFNVTVDEDMEPPIRVAYSIDPFYQNYLQYVLTVSSNEIGGKEVTSGNRKRCRDTKSDKTITGKEIVPCGLQATSFFNDTFELMGITIDQKDIAWKSDVERFSNPKDYPGRKDTSWLYMRYPTIVSEAEGVENERFVSWMRPEALARVNKPYGKLQTKLSKGQTLTVRINASFPVSTLKARKELVLTTYNALGGKSTDLVVFLAVTAALSGGLALVFLGIQLIKPRALGDKRFGTAVL